MAEQKLFFLVAGFIIKCVAEYLHSILFLIWRKELRGNGVTLYMGKCGPHLITPVETSLSHSLKMSKGMFSELKLYISGVSFTLDY